MTRKKRKSPYRHTGKLVPLRTKERILADVEHARSGIEPTPHRPNLNVWRDIIEQVGRAELDLLEKEGDQNGFLDRTAVLAECSAWLDLIQQRYLHDNRGNPIDVSHDDATNLAHNAIRIGYLMGHAGARVTLEAAAVDGWEHSERGRKRAERNREGAFSITRDELLARCRRAFRRYPGCNQKDLAGHVAASLPIGAERVRKLMQEHEIRKADYS